MKKKIIKEDIMDSHLWFVCDCDLNELEDWVFKKFNFEINVDTLAIGKFIQISSDYSVRWVVWTNNKISLSHELIHFVKAIFDFYEMTLSDDNEELFCKLHSYYLEKCLKMLKNKKREVKKNI